MRSWMIGLLLGIAPVALLPQLPGPGVRLLLALLALAALALPGRPGRCCAGLLAGAALAMGAGAAHLADRLPLHCESRALVVEGVVSSLPRVTLMRTGETRQRFEFSVARVQPTDCAGPRRILLSRYDPGVLQPGEHWQLPVRLRRPWGLANPGSHNMQAWYARTGIDAVGSVRVRGARRLDTGLGPGTVHHRLRGRISARLAALPLAADARAILRAVTVADRSGPGPPAVVLAPALRGEPPGGYLGPAYRHGRRAGAGPGIPARAAVLAAGPADPAGAPARSCRPDPGGALRRPRRFQSAHPAGPDHAGLCVAGGPVAAAQRALERLVAGPRSASWRSTPWRCWAADSGCPSAPWPHSCGWPQCGRGRPGGRSCGTPTCICPW